MCRGIEGLRYAGLAKLNFTAGFRNIDSQTKNEFSVCVFT